LGNYYLSIDVTLTGSKLTILGSSFTTERGFVVVGSELASISLWSDTRIDLTIGEIDSGWNVVKIGAQFGFAVNRYGSVFVDLVFALMLVTIYI
jgi:hypothetical protein